MDETDEDPFVQLSERLIVVGLQCCKIQPTQNTAHCKFFIMRAARSAVPQCRDYLRHNYLPRVVRCSPNRASQFQTEQQKGRPDAYYCKRGNNYHDNGLTTY